MIDYTKTKLSSKEILTFDFEEAQDRLEEVSKLLETETLPLEQSLIVFENGTLLAKHCKKLLKEAQIKINDIPRRKFRIRTIFNYKRYKKC